MPYLRTQGESDQKLLLGFSWSWGCSKYCFSRCCHLRSEQPCMTFEPLTPGCGVMSCHTMATVTMPSFWGWRGCTVSWVNRTQVQLWKRQVSVSANAWSGQCSAVGHFGRGGLLAALGCLRQAGWMALWKGVSFSFFIIRMKQDLLWGVELSSSF